MTTDWKALAGRLLMLAEDVAMAPTASDALDALQALMDTAKEVERAADAAWAEEDDD